MYRFAKSTGGTFRQQPGLSGFSGDSTEKGTDSADQVYRQTQQTRYTDRYSRPGIQTDTADQVYRQTQQARYTDRHM